MVEILRYDKEINFITIERIMGDAGKFFEIYNKLGEYIREEL